MYVAARQHLSDQRWAITGVATAAAVYLGFVAWLVIEPYRREQREAARAEAAADGGDAKTPLINGDGGG